jgi:prepilin peptidase CpaA
MQAHSSVIVVLVVLFTLVAAVNDVWRRRIPNWLTVPAFLGAVAFHIALGGLAGLRFSLLGFGTGFGLLFILWIFGGGGGGDVKLMGALGAWLGVRLTLLVFLASAVLILLLTVGAMVFGVMTRGMNYVRHRMQAGRLSHAAGKTDDESWRERRQRFRILPYAVPVALSTWLVLAATWLAARLAA